jgi:hypothetical protein
MIDGSGNGGFFLGLAVGATLVAVLTIICEIWIAGIASGPIGIGAAVILTAVLLSFLTPIISGIDQLLGSADEEFINCFNGGLSIGSVMSGFGIGPAIGAAILAAISATVTFLEVPMSGISCFE